MSVNSSASKQHKWCWCIPFKSQRYLPWLVLFWSGLNLIFLGAKRRSFGVIVSELHVEFNESSSLTELNWIGISYGALGEILSIAAGPLIMHCSRRYDLFQLVGAFFILAAHLSSGFVPNPSWLFLTHTVFHGIGSSLVLTCTGFAVNEYFDSSSPYHLLATTFISSGSIASFVAVPAMAYIIDELGWRYTFSIALSITFFIINGGAACFIQRNNSKIPQENVNNFDYRRILTLRQFTLVILWVLDLMLAGIVIFGLVMNLVDYMRSHLKKDSAVNSSLYATLFTAGEASNCLISVIVTSITQDAFFDRLRYLLFGSTLVAGVCLVSWEFIASNAVISTILAYLTGLSIASSLTFMFPAGAEMTRLPSDVAYLISMVALGCGMFLSPFLSAMIAEYFRYQYFFLVLGCTVLFKMFLLSVSILTLSTISTINIGPYENPNIKTDKNTQLEMS